MNNLDYALRYLLSSKHCTDLKCIRVCKLQLHIQPNGKKVDWNFRPMFIKLSQLGILFWAILVLFQKFIEIHIFDIRRKGLTDVKQKNNNLVTFKYWSLTAVTQGLNSIKIPCFFTSNLIPRANWATFCDLAFREEVTSAAVSPRVTWISEQISFQL